MVVQHERVHSGIRLRAIVAMTNIERKPSVDDKTLAIERENVCPFLLRVFWQKKSHFK